ncbi:aminoglycoside phosphotransferase family protein [Pseudophaeobacter flagellatus]|uniref:aminoglycoside phosphotransferase family protein n=1 Tax=Pseudophaeobacter flagellatus TaxID=2899119 RepID=UPI001E3A893F|nr:aminoglycoside phosphotransferase family protein [Pseudophaeobacter flagellatus]MCD9146202.1 phosphotransferase [Pseudophaeobacter flagellatus]
MNRPPPPAIPADLISTFQIIRTLSLQEVPRAQIWHVETRQYGQAALKHYAAGHMGNEASGFPFLAALQGPVAQIYQVTQNAVLMEWLPGPSLGDIARSGGQADADKTLAQVAAGIHSQTSALKLTGMMPLVAWFEALRAPLPTDLNLTSHQRSNLQQAQSLTKTLLASQEDIRPLHGDLHHDNIRQGAGGYCAFDAKGMIGERCYELANAFRHPKGLEKDSFGADLIGQRAKLWGQIFDVSPKRLLQWASAKCALSLVWRRGADLQRDPDLTLLDHLLIQQSRF